MTVRGYMYKSTISLICALFIAFTWFLNQEVISSEKGKSLWSLKKISSVEPPIIEEDSWSSNAIDKFILKRLKDNNIKPNPSAEKLTIIRRVSFDLLGLAPSKEDIEGFLADNSKGAYDKVLDKLLSSPHYGSADRGNGVSSRNRHRRSRKQGGQMARNGRDFRTPKKTETVSASFQRRNAPKGDDRHGFML